MNEKLHKSISRIGSLIEIQKQSLSRGYHHGLLNGLIISYAIIDESEPEFISVPGRNPRSTRVRHKSKIRNKNWGG